MTHSQSGYSCENKTRLEKYQNLPGTSKAMAFISNTNVTSVSAAVAGQGQVLVKAHSYLLLASELSLAECLLLWLCKQYDQGNHSSILRCPSIQSNSLWKTSLSCLTSSLPLCPISESLAKISPEKMVPPSGYKSWALAWHERDG